MNQSVNSDESERTRRKSTINSRTGKHKYNHERRAPHKTQAKFTQPADSHPPGGDVVGAAHELASQSLQELLDLGLAELGLAQLQRLGETPRAARRLPLGRLLHDAASGGVGTHEVPFWDIEEADPRVECVWGCEGLPENLCW